VHQFLLTITMKMVMTGSHTHHSGSEESEARLLVQKGAVVLFATAPRCQKSALGVYMQRMCCLPGAQTLLF